MAASSRHSPEAERVPIFNHWLRGPRAAPHLSHSIRIAFYQHNLEGLARLATHVSDPMHPEYGKYERLALPASLVRRESYLDGPIRSDPQALVGQGRASVGCS